jgi:hypothetical protein
MRCSWSKEGIFISLLAQANPGTLLTDDGGYRKGLERFLRFVMCVNHRD